MMYYSEIPDGTPNKEFYADLVCRCNELPGRKYGCAGTAMEYVPYPTPSRSKVCGKYDPIHLDICRNCGSVFYSAFNHPYQIKGLLAFPMKKLCWHCLEGGASTRLHDYYKKVPKVPPLQILLNPKIEPPTPAERLAAAKSTATDLEDILARFFN